MSYDAALSKAWLEVKSLSPQENHSINFLNDEYSIDLENQSILSLSCNVATEDFLSILLLHYLIRRIKGLPNISGEWLSFWQFEGGESYYPVFKRRVIAPILRKYGAHPEEIFNLVGRFKAKRSELADASIVLEVFDRVLFLIELWKADEEFNPEANVLFDKNITGIFCMEDVVVLSEYIAHQI